jgi:hypothetical protein
MAIGKRAPGDVSAMDGAGLRLFLLEVLVYVGAFRSITYSRRNAWESVCP